MDHKQIIQKIAEIILAELKHIDQNFEVRGPVAGDVFAYPDRSLTHGGLGQQSLRRLQTEVYIEQRGLRNKPFTAYVKAAIDEKEKIFFICRSYTPTGHMPLTSNADFVNYLSPMGRIAEMDVGDYTEIMIPRGEIEVVVLEKDKFRPEKKNRQWDGINNSFFLESGIYSIQSLVSFLESIRTFLKEQPDITAVQEIQLLERELQKELERKLNIRQGVIREVIKKIELRDQPTLDKLQGEIFRMPLASRLIITGAPGTGKTTLLIKRIAQKCNINYLELDEKAGLDDQQIQEFFHEENWIMFTPTELLKIYLKEAFAKELLPASDQRVKIWDEERLIISRDTLKFLKVGDQGLFRKVQNKIIRANNNFELIEYAKQFNEYYQQYLIDEFNKSRDIIKQNNINFKMIDLFDKIYSQLNQNIFKSNEDKILFLIEELKNLRDLYNIKRLDLNKKIESIANIIIESKENILQEVFKLIESFQADSTEDIPFAEEDYEFDEEEKEQPTSEWTIVAKRQIKRTVRLYCEWQAKNKKIPKSSIHAEIVEIIKFFLPEKDHLVEIGKKVVDGKATNILTRGYTNLLNRVPQYYQRFRLEKLKTDSPLLEKKFEKEIKERKICEHEIDLMIFVILRNAQKIFEKNINLLEENSKVDLLEEIKIKYATQIAVDEVTDFSSIQIGCIYHLAHPRFKSVALSGDLMQRVTDFGLAEWKECNFVSGRFEIYTVDTVYRQSPKLLRIAEVLYEKNIGQKAPFASAFHLNETDPEPLKFNSQNDNELLGQWISDRIVEIFNINKSLPSTAIFVSDDDQIDQAIKIIEKPLNENSIEIKGCQKGEILGSENKVRIFSVKYIKGLEFESVFFLNINEISERVPKLVDKYLYVGLSRAASFLAITYNNSFPDEIKHVENYFIEGNWKID